MNSTEKDEKDDYPTFVMQYAMQQDEPSLDCLVSNIGMNDDNTQIEADIQPQLIQAFIEAFPDADIASLDEAVQHILLLSIAEHEDHEADIVKPSSSDSDVS